MIWSRSDTLALAAPSCTCCLGLGMKTGRAKESPCNCVLRAVFRACFARFCYCTEKDRTGRISLEANPARQRKTMLGRKDEEFTADFCLVSRRTLSDCEYSIFKYHFLFGADFRLCCRRLNMDRGNFFHAVYRIEQKLGRVFRELGPYPLFPLDEYFGGTFQGAKALAGPLDAQAVPLRPPLQRVRARHPELLEVA
jgi:hypothetical protein